MSSSNSRKNGVIDYSGISNTLSSDNLFRIKNDNLSQITTNAILASESGNISLFKEIISSGSIDILNFSGMNGWTLLHYASSRGHILIVLELLKLCFPINKRNSLGETALHLAVYNGHILMVELLLDYGADINAVNDYNETPLFYAARRSMPAIVRLLLQRNADIDVKDSDDAFAKDHCKSNDISTLNAFKSNPVINCSGIKMPFLLIQNIFSYLEAKDVSKAAMVCSKWHRVAESEGIWQKLGIRRWQQYECAARAAVGLEMAPSLAFIPTRKSSSR